MIVSKKKLLQGIKHTAELGQNSGRQGVSCHHDRSAALSLGADHSDGKGEPLSRITDRCSAPLLRGSFQRFQLHGRCHWLQQRALDGATHRQIVFPGLLGIPQITVLGEPGRFGPQYLLLGGPSFCHFFAAGFV